MEIWDGYYRDGRLANIDLIRGEVIPEGLYHLVCEVIVRHIDGDYLLMKRDYAKPSYGGYYEASAGGSALKGEDEMSCIKRELFEETGICSDTFTMIGKNISKNAIFFSYLCVTDCDKSSITLQDGETISYKWVNEKEFIDFINSDEVIETQKQRYLHYFTEKGYLV